MFENVAGDSITVVAAESCRVWFMSAEHLTRRCEKACTHHSRLVENMFHIMTGKAAALSERVEVLSRRSIREKLLCYFGLQTGGDDCGSFHLPFTLSALADYISADRSAMMRELRKMKEEGLVAVEGRRVTLLAADGKFQGKLPKNFRYFDKMKLTEQDKHVKILTYAANAYVKSCYRI